MGCDSPSSHAATRSRWSTGPLCRDFSRQRSLSPPKRHLTPLVQGGKRFCFQVPRPQSSKEARHLTGDRTVSSDAPNFHDPLTRDQPAGHSTRQTRCPPRSPVEGNGPHNPRLEPPEIDVPSDVLLKHRIKLKIFLFSNTLKHIQILESVRNDSNSLDVPYILLKLHAQRCSLGTK